MVGSRDPLWLIAHAELKELMQKEISLMREVLSSLLQEENFLLNQAQEAWTQLMQERFSLIEKLKMARISRDAATQSLIGLSVQENREVSIEQAIFLEGGEGCEISLLLDQLMALTSKINQQNTRNQILVDQGPQWNSSPNLLSLLPRSSINLKKPVLMTMQEPLDIQEMQ